MYIHTEYTYIYIHTSFHQVGENLALDSPLSSPLTLNLSYTYVIYSHTHIYLLEHTREHVIT